MNQFSFFKSYFEATRFLDDSDRLEFYDAILCFMFEEKEPSFEGIKQMAWTLIKPNLETSKTKSKAKSANQTKSKKIKKDQNKSNGMTPLLGKGKGKGKGEGKRSREFIAPACEDVEKYFFENGYTREAGKNAWHYYHENAWHDSNEKPVKNWKSKVRAVWFKPENKETKSSQVQAGSSTEVVW